MAEVKNAFIRSKMNKDLDSRLIPSGEYRHAQNSQVSKSEGADVGSLENILGNEMIADLTDGNPNISSIGYLADNSTNNVYVFLTDNSNVEETYNKDATNIIFKYNIDTNTVVKLVEGAFLNFHKFYPIFGVNLLENLLFWTDNRNQPRKINTQKNLGYYTNEDQISVAKYYPFKSIELYKESSLAPGSYETAMLDVVSKNLPNGGSAILSSAVVSSSFFDINSLKINTSPNELKTGFTVSYVDGNGNIIDTGETVSSYVSPTLTLTGSVDIPLYGVGTELIFNANPYYEKDYSGDPSFLEDKFARFSYRFKFDDGEYSLLAPFTQICFIPKQDGYFLNTFQDEVTTDVRGDENETINSTIVKFMENKVNKIYLQLPLPTSKNELKPTFHIEEIDIIYKESDSVALQVLETIKIDESFTGLENILEYEYLAKKPYKTLPSSEVTRVYDKVPLKALSQEVISNRVVYGNYINKPSPPSSLNYNVSVTEKFDFNLTEYKTSIVEYPSSTVKMNREYQVGFVLADRFGRQSSVILSNNKESITVGNATYSGSSLYSPYVDETIGENIDSWAGNSLKILLNDPIPGGVNGIYNDDINSVDYNPTGWYSYKIVVKQTQQEYYNVYTAGAVKGDPFLNTEDRNNTFITLESDNINKVPRDLSEVGPDQKQYRSSTRLFGRVNIDSRSSSNTGNDNSQFYPGKYFFSVSNIQDLFDTFNIDRFDNTVSYAELYYFRNAASNPLLSRVITSADPDKQFGILREDPLSGGPMRNLAVLETDPEVSRLDIFWETSTSGIIKNLNESVAGNDSVSGFSSSFNNSFFSESLNSDENIFNTEFTLLDPIGANINPAYIDIFNMNYVEDNQPTPLDVSNYFVLYEVSPGFYNIKVTNDFITNIFYGADSGKRIFNFRFTAVINGVTTIIDKTLNLSNESPVMTPNGTLDIQTDGNTTNLATLEAVNGASDFSPNKGEDINWFIDSQSGIVSGTVNHFGLQFSNTNLLSTCIFQNNSTGSLPADIYTAIVKAEDAGGLLDSITIIINNSVVIGFVEEHKFEIDSGGFIQEYSFVIIQVTDSSDPDQIGYYSYLGSWDELSFDFVINIDYTNSAKFGACPVPTELGWILSSSKNTSIARAFDCYGYPEEEGNSTVSYPDTTDYSFTIV